ncbi:MAG: MBL fold metallo-hydrolase, partial [Candidatus Competibacteraceae bacterium]|nr:MBL fold metallo-hydrolase [Candidatus Competibacteraceae bacterium]
MKPDIKAFFDPDTYTVSYVVADPDTRQCAIIDSVLDYEPNSGRTKTQSADQLIAYIKANALTVEWILETHAHADHLSAAPYLKAQLGGKTGIGQHITHVQQVFGQLFNAEAGFHHDGSQFDRLLADNETFTIGKLTVKALHTPGHTPACMSYLIGDDAVFVGDTLFMPDYGTARCDFPGGDARVLYRSIQRILALPDSTRIFLCHDYKAPGRDEYCWETTVGAEKHHNVHVHEGISEDDFVRMRSERDATLDMPRLILPSVQVNMRAGQLPPAEDNGIQ